MAVSVRPILPAPERRFSRLLVATDLSSDIDPAADRAVELASQLGASLVFVSVIDPGSLRRPDGGYGTRIDRVRLDRDAAARRLVAAAEARGVPASFLVWQGDPGEAIVEAADAEGADLIVVGSHGRGRVGRFVMGSVSDHVIRHASRPVMVVRGSPD